MTAPQTAWTIGEQSASKPLGRFGCKVIQYPVREGIEQAERDDAPLATMKPE